MTSTKSRQSGKQLSIYLPNHEYQLLQQLATTSGSSVSKILATAVKQQCIAQHENLLISEGSYLALAAGRFDLLRKMTFDDAVVITVDESAFKEKGGKRGDLADKMDELRSYLDMQTKGDDPVAVTR